EVIRRLVLLIASCFAFWAIASLLAHNIWGGPAIAYSAIAMAICLGPAAATLCWTHWAAKQAPDQQLTVLLGGTGLRLFAVLLGAFVLYSSIPFLHQDVMPLFWTWVLASYMVTLTA